MNEQNQNNEGQNNVVTQTADNTNVNKTEGSVTQTEKKTEVKTFTQDEVNAMLAKERKNMPDEKELKAFKEWREAQKTEEQKKQEEIIKNQKLQEKNDFNSQIIEVMKKGLDYDTAEFVQFKVSKMDGDFNENLEAYLRDHPQTTKTEEKKSVTTGFSQTGTNEKVSEEKAYLDKKYANNPYYKK